MHKPAPDPARPDIVSALPATPLLVACHDAGAANLIFGWLRYWLTTGKLNPSHLLLALQGPAKAIAANSGLTPLGRDVALDNLSIPLGCVLSGTGWQSDWEHRARRLARSRKIPSIAVLDHWVNYASRFIRDDGTCLPDALWVSDEHAERIAQHTFPSLQVVRQPNLYLDSQVANIPALSPGKGDTLYLLEPARTTWGRRAEGEFQALDYFIQERHRLIACPESRVRLRPHPSDPAGKYDAWLSRHPSHDVCLDDAPDLSISIARASVVVGMQTAAMVIALAAGRAVYSSLPPWAGELALPHDGIRQIRHLS